MVVEQFAPAFLHEPAVVLISDGGVMVIVEDAALVVALGLQLRPDRLLPDVILFDLRDGKELLVFVEVVSTDGPVTEARRESLLLLGTDAGFPPDKVAFVTAYQDRDHQAFKKTVGALAWNSLIWFASEPDHIIMLRERPILTTGRIFDLLQ